VAGDTRFQPSQPPRLPLACFVLVRDILERVRSKKKSLALGLFSEQDWQGTS
jgi:hypothetical protein